METFGARSRFQAGVIAAGLGLLEPKRAGGAGAGDEDEKPDEPAPVP